MADVFISYSREDHEIAENLFAELEERKIHCWLDTKNILKGEHYDDRIANAILRCNVVVILISENSLASENVKNELRIAVAYKKEIIPFMLERVTLRDAFIYHIEANNRIFADENWTDAVRSLIASLDGYLSDTGDTHVVVKCPQCGSEKLSKIDLYVFLSVFSQGCVRLYDYAANLFGICIAILGLTYLLYKIPFTNEYVLNLISVVPVLDKFFADNFGIQILKLAGIAFVIPFVTMITWAVFYYLETTYFRKIVKSGGNEVDYTCLNCRHAFKIRHTPDEARLRSEQAKKNKFNLAAAAGLVLGFAIMLVLLYAARKILFQISLWVMLIILVIILISLAFIVIKEAVKYKRQKKELDRIKGDIDHLDSVIEHIGTFSNMDSILEAIDQITKKRK